MTGTSSRPEEITIVNELGLNPLWLRQRESIYFGEEKNMTSQIERLMCNAMSLHLIKHCVYGMAL